GAAEIRATAIEQEPQRLGVLLELVLTHGDRWEGDAVRRELDLVPSRPEAAVRAAAAEVIDRAQRLRENTRVAVPNAEDEATDADLRGLDGRGRQRGDRFEAIDIAALRWRFLEVIGDREPIESAFVGESPEAPHLLERTPEMADVYSEPS